MVYTLNHKVINTSTDTERSQIFREGINQQHPLRDVEYFCISTDSPPLLGCWPGDYKQTYKERSLLLDIILYSLHRQSVAVALTVSANKEYRGNQYHLLQIYKRLTLFILSRIACAKSKKALSTLILALALVSRKGIPCSLLTWNEDDINY